MESYSVPFLDTMITHYLLLTSQVMFLPFVAQFGNISIQCFGTWRQTSGAFLTTFTMIPALKMQWIMFTRWLKLLELEMYVLIIFHMTGFEILTRCGKPGSFWLACYTAFPFWSSEPLYALVFVLVLVGWGWLLELPFSSKN